MFGLSSLKLAIMAGLALVAFGAGWTVQGWRMGETIASNKAAYAVNIQKITEAGAAAERANTSRLADVQSRLAQADVQHTKELSDANAQISAAAHTSFSVRAKCPASGSGSNILPGAAAAPGVGHGAGAGRAILDAAVAEHLLAIAADADRSRVKLAACQAYATSIQLLGDKR